MEQKTCGFTGHRKLDWYQGALATAEILGAVMKAASEGYTRFITGLADGTDMIFADNVISVRETFGLKLELVAAISHRGRLNTKNKDFQKYIAQCDHVEVLSERYLPSVYEKRNRWIVDQSSLLIAAYDGRKSGGTYNTLAYARGRGMDIRILDVSQAAVREIKDRPDPI